MGKTDTNTPSRAEDTPGIPSDQERPNGLTSAHLWGLLGESRCCLVLGIILGWSAAGI